MNGAKLINILNEVITKMSDTEVNSLLTTQHRLDLKQKLRRNKSAEVVNVINNCYGSHPLKKVFLTAGKPNGVNVCFTEWL